MGNFHQVCRPTIDSVCNVHGNINSNCSSRCYCKEGYYGEHCEFCDWRNHFYSIDGTEGLVNSTNGGGVQCTGKYFLAFES